MATLDHLRGARVPLFDRFHPDGKGGRGGPSLLEWHAARQDGMEYAASPLERSIERELSRLLNTRCACTIEQLATRERSVVDYGLPDYSALYTANLDDQKRLAALVRDTIAAFEPRLREIQVEVARIANSRHALRVSVGGMVLVEGRLEPVRFNLSANGDSAEAP
ncbi:MAG: type VI secretion system baseplate subunit TssE [Pseudomonadota bacterium]